MKRVLIIVYTSPSASRVEGLVKYLPEFNWEPVILTATTSKYTNLPARIVVIPHQENLGLLGHLTKSEQEKDVRQQIKKRLGITSQKSALDPFLTLGGGIATYPYTYKKWKPAVLGTARILFQAEKIDAVISSAPPVVSHIICNELKVELKIPWLADLRDLWSQNHNYSYGPVRRLVDRRLELRTLSKADALVTVSQIWADKLSALHKDKTTYTITHGFDPEAANIPPAKLTNKFTITYTGTIYAGKQDPVKLFAALRDLISNRIINPEEIEVRFYGSEQAWFNKEIEQYGLLSIVKHYGRVPKDIALGKQRESQLLLLLDWDDPQEKGVSTAKIYEYLGTRRPILATGGVVDDVVAELLNRTKAGTQASTVEDIKETLKNLYQDYKLKGALAYNGIDSEVNKYSHREMARQFSEILDRLAP